MSQDLQFGYFNLQGRGQVARLLMAYTKTQYKEVTYTFAEIGNWLLNDKINLNLDFPSLPYLIDGKLNLTQSKAIELYIIHRAKMSSSLLGKNHKEQALIANIDGVLKDVFNALIGIFFTGEFEDERKRVFAMIEQKLHYLNEYIGLKGHFLDRVTYVDFVVTVVYSYLQLFYPYEYSKWANIHRVAHYINGLPEIVEYYSKNGAISDVVAPQRANDPRFHNIPPIHEVSSPVEEEESLQIAEQSSSPVEEQNIQQQIHAQTIKKTKSSNLEQQPHQPQQPTLPEPHFITRVSDYEKAVQATNIVEYSQVKVDMKKSSIVTPSKIESSIKTNGALQASWKILNVGQQQNQKETQKSVIITLGYWAIRGLGQVQRHLLSYCGHEFTETVYRTRDEWMNADKKFLPFPNLPYLVQGDFSLTQSLAIDRYIIRTSSKRQLLGRNLVDETLIENAVKILSEIFKQLRVLCFATEGIEQTTMKLRLRIDGDFGRMGEVVQDRGFVFGYLTWVDFYVAEVAYYIEKMFPDVYERYGFLGRIQQAVNKTEGVQKYYERESSVKGPFMPPSARIFF